MASWKVRTILCADMFIDRTGNKDRTFIIFFTFGSFTFGHRCSHTLNTLLTLYAVRVDGERGTKRVGQR